MAVGQGDDLLVSAQRTAIHHRHDAEAFDDMGNIHRAQQITVFPVHVAEKKDQRFKQIDILVF